MTTLIRLTLNTRNRAAQTDLANAHHMHRRVMSLLPNNLGDHARQTTATLYRIEETRTGTRLLVQTTGQPTYDRLPADYTLTIASLDLDRLYARLAPGGTVRYSITANPTWNPAVGPAAGKVIPIDGYDNILTWWTRKAAAAGLDITDRATDIRPAPGVTGRRRSNGTATQQITHRATLIVGTGTITDTTTLTNALRDGIGRGKSYGLGLLTVLPLTANPASTAA